VVRPGEPDPADFEEGQGPSLAALLSDSWLQAGMRLQQAWPAPQRLSPLQVVRFAAEQRWCALATVDRSGMPRSVPTSFVLDPAGRFWLPTVTGASRLNHIARNPRAAITAGQGIGEGHTCLIAWGPAEIRQVAAVPAPITAAAASKLGDLSWVGAWNLVKPQRLLAYGERRRDQLDGNSSRSPG
jgi:predicted pyridoxine 5'-phosphate oxidase superfamily flavin-nucleotide-binding protein